MHPNASERDARISLAWQVRPIRALSATRKKPQRRQRRKKFPLKQLTRFFQLLAEYAAQAKYDEAMIVYAAVADVHRLYGLISWGT